MVVDATAPLTIRVLAEAKAFIEAIRISGDNGTTWAAVYPEGETAYARAGAICWMNFRLRNAGDAAGTLYLKVTNDGGYVIFNQSYALGIGEYVDVSNPAPTWTMPNRDFVLTIEVGH